jgi:hypothetical protein
MGLHHHAGVPVGRARPRNHHLGLNFDTHEDLLSLLQSNVRWPLSLLPNNQVEDRVHDCAGEDRPNTKYDLVVPGPSAHTPDVPQQLTELIDVAQSVRECVREKEWRRDAS